MENALHPSRFRFGISLFSPVNGERIVLPFKRSMTAILIVAAFAILMTVPAISVFGQAARDWGRLEDLFDLTGALFSTGWLMGWSMGLFVLYTLLAALAFGREVLILRPGTVEIRIGLPFMFVGVELDPGNITRMHFHKPKPKSSKAWRGTYLAFDYADAPMEVGSGLSELAATQLADRIRALPATSRKENTAVADTAEVSASAETGTPAAAANDDKPDAAPSLTSLSALALIAANLLPVLGVLLFGWDLGTVMVLFWAESGIIACYHLLKLCVIRRWLVLLLGPVFVGHFGAFMAIHFLFVYGLFIEGPNHSGPGDSLAEVAQVFIKLWPALLALVISHGISFAANFLGRQEFRHMTLNEQMAEPYRRVVIMHLTLIIGGGLSLLLNSPLAALILLILLKIIVDLKAHQKQHMP